MDNLHTMKKDVIFALKKREQIREGAELLYKAVSSTLDLKIYQT